jgi:tRNA dimethylallyltransferase
MTRRKILAIVGATATGKSALAIELAERFEGESVSIDAYAVYRGMDVGTAKPSDLERARVPHHLIDVTDPDETMTLARFLEEAQTALDAIWARGRLPVLAGGSGQYLWALLEGWQVPRVAPDPALREELEALAIADGPLAVHARLAAVDPEAAERLDAFNTRRLIRALEVVTRTGLPLSVCQTRQAIDADVLILGLRMEREEHLRRLDERVDAMYASGFVAEVAGLRAHGYGETSPVRRGVGYKEISLYLDGSISLPEAIQRTKFANHKLARGQAAWFKSADPRIEWLDALSSPNESAIGRVERWLAGGRGDG